ncbi:MAG: hypothetical protein WCG25_07775 [bacterium]
MMVKTDHNISGDQKKPFVKFNHDLLIRNHGIMNPRVPIFSFNSSLNVYSQYLDTVWADRVSLKSSLLYFQPIGKVLKKEKPIKIRKIIMV